jgi:hypothetical protein
MKSRYEKSRVVESLSCQAERQTNPDLSVPCIGTGCSEHAR